MGFRASGDGDAVCERRPSSVTASGDRDVIAKCLDHPPDASRNLTVLTSLGTRLPRNSNCCSVQYSTVLLETVKVMAIWWANPVDILSFRLIILLSGGAMNMFLSFTHAAAMLFLAFLNYLPGFGLSGSLVCSPSDITRPPSLTQFG